MEREINKLKTFYNDGEIVGMGTRKNKGKSRVYVTFVHNTTIINDPKTPKNLMEALMDQKRNFGSKQSRTNSTTSYQEMRGSRRQDK